MILKYAENLVTLNSSPNIKILAQFKFSAIADDKINGTQKLKFVSGRVGNIFRKGENAGYQHFLLFPKCFQKPSSSGSLKVGLVWYRVKGPFTIIDGFVVSVEQDQAVLNMQCGRGKTLYTKEAKKVK